MPASVYIVAIVWVTGVLLAEHELRLRHHGYEYELCKDGKVRRFPITESDHHSNRWVFAIFSWALYLPYRIYRIKHQVFMPTTDEVTRTYSAT